MSNKNKNLKPSVLSDLSKKIDGGDSELSKVVDTLLNNKWRRRKTRIKGRLNSDIASLDAIAQIWDIKFLQAFIDNYTEYATSVDGKGRQEIVDITKFTIDKETNARREMMEHLGRR